MTERVQTEHLLEQLRIGAQKSLSPSLLYNMRLDEIQSYLTHQLVYQLTTYVQAEHLADSKESFHFEWERSRWQRWKRHHRFIAKWLKVKYFKVDVHVAVKTWAIYPDSTIIHPDLGPRRILQQVDSDTTQHPL